jgi:BNR/Asp-box repeat
VARDQLYLSRDFGATWVQRTLVSGVALDASSGNVLSSVFVLDASHAWTASPGPGSTVPYDGSGPQFDHLHVVISRTTDGGVTWQSLNLPGDWGGRQPVLAFADGEHGFLLLSGLRGGGGSVVFATQDGGATWQRVGGADSLGSIFSASAAATLWAGNEGDAGPVARPILDVSRDGGRTWVDARLPGLVGDIYVNDNPVAPPVFSGQNGAVAVIAASTDTSPMVRFYRSSDGGRTWLLAAQVHIGESGSTGVAVVDALHYVVIDSHTGQLQATSDGGVTWQPAASRGLGAAMRLRFWDARNGVAIVQTTNGPAPAAGVLRTTDGGQTWSPVAISPHGPSTTEVPSPAPLPSAGGTCSASQFVLGTPTYAYGFGTLGTTVVFVTQPLRNAGGSCVLDLPEMIGVAAATGPFHSVPVSKAGTATAWASGSGQSLPIVIGASWWVGVRDENGNPVGSAPPCSDQIFDVTRVELPFAFGSTLIDLPTTWHEVCSSPASVSVTFQTK